MLPFFCRCRNSIKHYYLEMIGCSGCYKFGMGEFDTLKELLDHFECMPVLGNLSGKWQCRTLQKMT